MISVYSNNYKLDGTAFFLQELREKNWKAMDALSAAEKQHQGEIRKAVESVKVSFFITQTNLI